MGSVQSPLVGLEMTAETATYVGLLEGQLAAYAVQEAKFRALLELMTGESWETTRLDIDGNALMAVAVDALMKSTGASLVAARGYVSQNWSRLNTVTTTPIPQATPIEELVKQIQTPANNEVIAPPKPATMAERLADWRARQTQSLATATAEEEAKEVAVEEDSIEEPTTDTAEPAVQPANQN